MTDQEAYRRYTAAAEKHLANACVPQLHIVFPDPLTDAEQRAVLDRVTEQGYDPAQVVISGGPSVEDMSLPLLAAQVCAMLALAAAQDRVQPADRPIGDTPQPRHVTDGEGDPWDRHADGLYYLRSARHDIQPVGYTLAMIAKAHDGYTEVT